MGMERSLPSHLLRTLVYRGPEEACARMSPAVRRRLGWSRNHKPVAPAAGVLRPISAASAGADWDGWAVDVRLELANLVFPTGLPGDASLARLLETDSNSALGLDSEMSWHLHEILARLAVLGKTGAKAGGKLAERLWGLSRDSHLSQSCGSLLPLHQRELLTHHFAAQLEMSGNWQAAAYVLVASAPPSPPADADMRDTGDAHRLSDADALACQHAALALQALLGRHAKEEALIPSNADPVIIVGNVHRLSVDVLAERLRVDRAVVLGWFRQAQAWAHRDVATSLASAVTNLRPSQRLNGNKELSLCLASGAWLRANELLLSLIAPADLPDPSRDYRPQHTMLLLRRLDGGMAGFRRSKEWSHYRSLDTWSQGCGAMLALIEVYEALVHIGSRPDLQHQLPALMLKVKNAGNVLRTLPPRTQRAVDNLYSKVSQALWLTTQVPQQGLADSADMVTLNELALEPSAQLRLLHKLAVAKLQPLNAGAALGGAGEDEMPVETETEMC